MHGKVRCGSDCKLTITDHSAVAVSSICVYPHGGLYMYYMSCGTYIQFLQSISLITLHARDQSVCSSRLNGKYPFKTRKTYFTSFCLLKCLWNIVTLSMYRTAPPPSLRLSAEDRLLNSRQDMNRVRSESGGHPLSLCCHDLADTDTFVYIFLL